MHVYIYIYICTCICISTYYLIFSVSKTDNIYRRAGVHGGGHLEDARLLRLGRGPGSRKGGEWGRHQWARCELNAF